VVPTYNPSYSGGGGRKIKSETLSEKQTKSKRTEAVAQVVECLLSKCEALSLISSIAKKLRIWRLYGP
jgi:hypothetical protein